MPVEQWSENVALARMADDPQFADDMEALILELKDRWSEVVLDLSQMTFLNSSNLGALLRLRKRMLDLERRLILCGASTHIWGTFIATGLDKIFEFSPDVSTALASMHIGKT